MEGGDGLLHIPQLACPQQNAGGETGLERALVAALSTHGVGHPRRMPTSGEQVGLAPGQKAGLGTTQTFLSDTPVPT